MCFTGLTKRKRETFSCARRGFWRTNARRLHVLNLLPSLIDAKLQCLKPTADCCGLLMNGGYRWVKSPNPSTTIPASQESEVTGSPMHATILKRFRGSAALLRMEDVLIEGPDEAKRPSYRGQLVRHVKRLARTPSLLATTSTKRKKEDSSGKSVARDRQIKPLKFRVRVLGRAIFWGLAVSLTPFWFQKLKGTGLTVTWQSQVVPMSTSWKILLFDSHWPKTVNIFYNGFIFLTSKLRPCFFLSSIHFKSILLT